MTTISGRHIAAFAGPVPARLGQGDSVADRASAGRAGTPLDRGMRPDVGMGGGQFETRSAAVRSLLPQETMTCGALSIAVRQETARGGDASSSICDFFDLGQGQVAVVIGEVIGAGPESAGRVEAARAALKASLNDHQSPCIAMARLNDFLCAQDTEASDDVETLALSLAVIDERTGEVTCVSAGSDAPLMLRVDGTWDDPAAPGMLVGVEPRQAYRATTLRMEPGDVLLLTTAGITDAHLGSSCLGYYGMAYLAVCSYAAAPFESDKVAAFVAESVLRGARAFAGGNLHDDACLIAIRRGH